jgi:release factor glutamine methyltransferase
MTVLKEWLSAARQRLTEAGQDDADSTLEWWAAHLLGCNRPTVRIRSATCELSLDLEARLEAGLTRLAAGEPLQYVTGETSFFGRPFRCDPRALIPRPETEELVDRALQELRTARLAHRPPRD